MDGFSQVVRSHKVAADFKIELPPYSNEEGHRWDCTLFVGYPYWTGRLAWQKYELDLNDPVPRIADALKHVATVEIAKPANIKHLVSESFHSAKVLELGVIVGKALIDTSEEVLTIKGDCGVDASLTLQTHVLPVKTCEDCVFVYKEPFDDD